MTIPFSDQGVYSQLQAAQVEVERLRAEIEQRAALEIRLFDERDRLEAEVERLQAALTEYANPDNWEHRGEYLWFWNGYPPFERATWTLLDKPRSSAASGAASPERDPP